MARPSKKTIEYFPHFVTHGKTMFVLESKYGNDGYAFWFKLLEILGNSDGLVYDCNNVSDWEFLIAKTKINEEIAYKMLNTLSELDAIDKELWTNKIIWSDNLVSNISDAFKRRVAEKPIKPSLCIQKPSENDVSANINGERKEKKRKEKESKENERKEEERESINISTSASSADAIKVFEDNIHPCSPLEYEKLNDWMTDVEPGVVIGAVEEAVIYNKRSMGYISAILNNWLKTGIRTKESMDAYRRDRADEKNQNQTNNSNTTLHPNVKQALDLVKKYEDMEREQGDDS